MTFPSIFFKIKILQIDFKLINLGNCQILTSPLLYEMAICSEVDEKLAQLALNGRLTTTGGHNMYIFKAGVIQRHEQYVLISVSILILT